MDAINLTTPPAPLGGVENTNSPVFFFLCVWLVSYVPDLCQYWRGIYSHSKSNSVASHHIRCVNHSMPAIVLLCCLVVHCMVMWLTGIQCWNALVVQLGLLHGCTLLDFLVEVRGNGRGTSVDFRGCCYWLPWESAGSHGEGHGSWPFHGKCHGCGHGTCRDAVRGILRGINHGNPRKSAVIATAISADVKPQQFPRLSAAILRYPATATDVHGDCRSNSHGIPQPSTAIELPRYSTAISLQSP